jgi:Skp family chaperone for outer membrane proteins
MVHTSPSRRRQRSVRVTVAIALMALGTVAVVVALSIATVAALSVASVFSLLCGWAAARIVYSELVDSRRVHARDRAAQAQSFKTLFTERSEEHASFAAAMSDRLTAREREVRELEGTLRLSEGRATNAEERVRREARRANQAQERVAELEVALAIRTAEEADELASWVPGGHDDMDTVVDLLRWEDRSQALQAEAIIDEAPVKKRA